MINIYINIVEIKNTTHDGVSLGLALGLSEGDSLGLAEGFAEGDSLGFALSSGEGNELRDCVFREIVVAEREVESEIFIII